MSRRRSNGIDVGSTGLVNAYLPVSVLIKIEKELEKLLRVLCSRSRRLSGRVFGVHVMTVMK